MGAGESLALWGLTLLFTPGLLSGQWAVWYPENPVCAVRGSTVVIPCTYDYPRVLTVETVMWCHNDKDCVQTSFVCHSDNYNISTEYRDRGECLGIKVKNCTLKIKNIKDTDAGVYKFRFETNSDSGKWYGADGVVLHIDELKIGKSPFTGNGTARKGDSVNLTCNTKSCSLSQSGFTWYKNNWPIPETHSTLKFNSVSYTDSGNYTCALKGFGDTVSASFTLDVISEDNMSTVIIAVGTVLSALTVTVVLAKFVQRRKAKLPSDKQDRREVIQDPEDNEYFATPEYELSPTRIPRKEEEDNYIAVQFHPNHPPKSDQEDQADTVIYSSVVNNEVTHSP